jgi:hypothetical protein
MGRSNAWLRISFLHFERSEAFVEAVSYLTAFYYLLEANGIGNYMCDTSKIALMAGEGYTYQKQECIAINFPLLFIDGNCIEKDGKVVQPDASCTALHQVAQECGYLTGPSSPITPISLVAILLGVSIGVLLMLLYFVAEPESEEQKLERRYWSKQGCKNYAFQRLKSIRLFACVVQFVAQLLVRIYYKNISDRQYCKMPSITTQTGLLILWPLAIIATAFSAYPLGTPLGSPLHFRCVEGKAWKDTAEEEADAQAAMDALRAAQATHEPWKRATAQAFSMTEMNGTSPRKRHSSSSSSDSPVANGGAHDV